MKTTRPFTELKGKTCVPVFGCCAVDMASSQFILFQLVDDDQCSHLRAQISSNARICRGVAMEVMCSAGHCEFYFAS